MITIPRNDCSVNVGCGTDKGQQYRHLRMISIGLSVVVRVSIIKLMVETGASGNDFVQPASDFMAPSSFASKLGVASRANMVDLFPVFL